MELARPYWPRRVRQNGRKAASQSAARVRGQGRQTLGQRFFSHHMHQIDPGLRTVAWEGFRAIFDP